MPRLSDIERQRAIGMLQAGMRPSHVAQHFNVSPSTIGDLRLRLAQTGTVADRPRTGRPRVTTPQQDRQIRLAHLRNRLRPATWTANTTPGRHNQRISAQTVRNRLRSVQLRARRPYRGPQLTDQRRAARLQWVNQRIRWGPQRWNSILFTDESRFCLSPGDGRARVWRRVR